MALFHRWRYCFSFYHFEDCGYMVRIAFVMDRVFRHFGLSGKSFIPLLISSGCGIPGIMASRTIEQDNDRRLTIMTATFIPCGGKASGYRAYGRSDRRRGGRICRKFLHRTAYVFYRDCGSAYFCYNIEKKTKMFSGKPAPFVMELPQYHMPQAKTVLLHVWERLKGFMIKAGTILFLACIVMCSLEDLDFQTENSGLFKTVPIVCWR